MDAMVRTYGLDDDDDAVALWTSGLSVPEILAIEEERARRRRPANDDPSHWSVVRDHSPDDLHDWLDGVDAPMRHDGPCMPRIVKDATEG